MLTPSPTAAAELLLDQLVGILPADRIVDPSLAARRASIEVAGDLPRIPEPQSTEAHWRPLTLEDIVGWEEVDKLDPDDRTMADELRSALGAARNSAEPSALKRLEAALSRVLGDQHTPPAPDHPAYGFVVSACETLAQKGAFTPATALGNTVAELLLDAAGRDPEDPV